MEKYYWISRTETENLGRAIETVKTGDCIALDTEYDSFRYFRDKLCLIQIRMNGETFIIDPLSMSDLGFLGEALADPAVKVIAHAADSDIRLLKRDYGFCVTNLFDTYRAAMLLGHKRLSLAHLIEDFLQEKIEKKKKMQRSRWDLRPLDEDQLKYAALDVRYLEDLYLILQEAIDREGLRERSLASFEEATRVIWQERTIDDYGYRRIKGFGELDQEEKQRLRKLYRWRFHKAGEKNRSPFMILSDETLLKLSRLRVLSPESVSQQGLLPRDKIYEYGSEIIALFS